MPGLGKSCPGTLGSEFWGLCMHCDLPCRIEAETQLFDERGREALARELVSGVSTEE